jgi:hypothetical protein
VVRPKVRIKIAPNLLARDRQENKDTGPMPGRTRPSGIPAGYDNASKPAGDTPALGTGSIDAPNTPKLDVSDGIKDVFDATGGNLNNARNITNDEAFRAPSAMRDALEAAPGGTKLDGSIGGRSASTEFDGPPRAGGQVSDSGHASSGGGGWKLGYHWRDGNTTGSVYTRQTQNGTATFEVERNGDATTVSITYPGPNKTSTRETTTTTGPRDGSGPRTFTQSNSSSNGPTTTEESRTTATDALPTAEDQDGNGVPDDVDAAEAKAAEAGKTAGDKKVGNKKIAVGDTKAGGGDQGGDWVDPNYRDRGGSIWTPLRGTVDRRVTPLDKTSQPPPTDVQGTVMVSGGSSGPTLGPEAVTNTGGGDFIAGEGRGGGGGGGMGPCATVRDCSDPGGGGIAPGPAGLEERPASN